jgi:hypothetical protein
MKSESPHSSNTATESTFAPSSAAPARLIGISGDSFKAQKAGQKLRPNLSLLRIFIITNSFDRRLDEARIKLGRALDRHERSKAHNVPRLVELDFNDSTS